MPIERANLISARQLARIAAMESLSVTSVHRATSAQRPTWSLDNVTQAGTAPLKLQSA